MANYYAKLVGAFPIHSFASAGDRKVWMDANGGVATKTVDEAEAFAQANDEDYWMVCHFPSKPDPDWDDGEQGWYPVDAHRGDYEVEWSVCRIDGGR